MTMFRNNGHIANHIRKYVIKSIWTFLDIQIDKEIGSEKSAKSIILLSFDLIIDRKAREIIRLVMSIHPSVCLSVDALTSEYSPRSLFVCP